MDSYHISVTDILLLIEFSDSIQVCIFSKENELKYSLEVTEGGLPSEILTGIYSAKYLIISKGEFLLIPNSVTVTESYQHLAFGEEAAVSSFKQSEFNILSNVIVDSDYTSLVGLEKKIDLGVMFKQLNDTKKSDAIFFYEIDGQLTLLAWKKGSFELANRYVISSQDEMFYYIMLVVDQLGIDASNVDFSTVASNNSFVDYQHQFKEYLSALRNLSVVEASSNREALTSYLARCVL